MTGEKSVLELFTRRKLRFEREIMAILVTGGAGYIGSVTVERSTAKGESIVVLDDLAYGHLESVDAVQPRMS